MHPPDTLQPLDRSTSAPGAPAPNALDELIGGFFEAAAEPSRWPFWFGALAARIGHRASNLVIHGFGPTRYVSLDAPASGFGTLNPARVFERKALSRNSFAIAYNAGELVEDWAQLQRDGVSGTGVQVFADDTRSLVASDRRLLRAVLPHLHRALALHFELEGLRDRRDALVACLDELGPGIALLDRGANLVHANRGARDCLEECSELVDDAGKLRAPNREAHAALERNLERVFSAEERTLRCQPLGGGVTLWLRRLGRDRAIAFIARDQSERSMAPGLLEDAFDLTPAQARVGSLLALGRSVDEIAAELGTSVHTARLHLKKIQKKTGTHRQATLVRRMLETIPRVRS